MGRRPPTPSDLCRLHIAIRHPEYLAGSAERPELGVFTQTHAGRSPVPWGQVAAGDPILVKLAGGPIVARAQVSGFRLLGYCDAPTLRHATLGFGLHDLDDYWSRLPPRFFGVVLFVGGERWIDDPYTPATRSRGASWIVAVGDARDGWMQPGAHEAAIASDQRPTRPSIPAQMRFFVLRRDGFACTYCGRRALRDGVVLHVDHVVPVRAGGLTRLDNLRAACVECNLGKGTQSLDNGKTSAIRESPVGG